MSAHAPAWQIRTATDDDVPAMLLVEQAAQTLLFESGIDLDQLQVPPGFEETTTWTLALVAEVDGEVVGIARLTELDPGFIALDQVSVKPDFAAQGVGRGLLTGAMDAARAYGYMAITGTTFEHVPFNAPFYARLGCVEDPDPHPTMVERRRVERALGLDSFGSRVIMRLSL